VDAARGAKRISHPRVELAHPGPVCR
jgi:hypothetical protein